MSAIILDEGLVHYEVLGRGRPLVFLHGWLGSWRYWMPTMDNLSDRFRTYAFDMWGFGDSDRNPQRYSLEAYVAQLDLFMEELGVMKASLVGHAMGAAVALLFAERYPDRVDRIMAVSTPLAASAVSKRLMRAAGGRCSIGCWGAAPYPIIPKWKSKPPRPIRTRWSPPPDRWTRSICAGRWMNWIACRRCWCMAAKIRS